MVEDESGIEGVVASVKDGTFDGHLVKLIEAVRFRFDHGTTAQRWKLTYEGQVFSEDDLTLGEAATVEKVTGTSWGMLNPVSSGSECQAIIASCLHHRDGVKLVDAMKTAGQMTAADAVAAISSYEVEAAPKDLGE